MVTQKKELKELEEFFIPEHRVQVQDPPLGRGGFGIVRIAELLPAEGSQLGAETVVVKELMSDNWNIIPLRAAYVSPTVNDVLGGPTNVRVSTPKRLTREMKVWAKCHHENILKFIGYHLGDDFKPAYLVSEYMRNGNAREYLAKNEMITGLHPYHDAKNTFMVIASLQNRKTPEPTPPPALATPLLELLRECWSFEPNERPDVFACIDVVDGLTRQQVSEVSTEPFKDETLGTLSLDRDFLNEALAGLHRFYIPKHKIRITRRLADGRYGPLYLVELESEGISTTTIAVAKVLKAENWDVSPLRLAYRLAREIGVLSTCQHRNITELLGYYLSDDFQESYIISPWMKNGNVSDYIARERPSIAGRMQLLRDVSEGLHYLHSGPLPIVHGDMIPGNVLVDDDGRAVLSDFALAKLLQDTRTGLTTSVGHVRHVRWLAPELLLGDGRVPLSSDIWGWGCLALTMIADEIPYSKMGTDARIIVAIATGRTPLPTPVPVSLNGLLPILQKCWNMNPKERPDSLACKSAVASLV
ncbi:hypothetical protein FRC05_002795 [Tulasnella sp. 425]|nr:hypothetical protein FRC05_002795 [Tulasnella sp. 425]